MTELPTNHPFLPLSGDLRGPVLVQEQVVVFAAAAAAQLPAEGEAGLGDQGADRDRGQLRRRPQHAQEALHQANLNHEGSACSLGAFIKYVSIKGVQMKPIFADLKY